MSVYDREFEDALAAYPGQYEYPLGPDEYAEHVYKVKRAVSIPVIGSLNGRTAESWLKFALIIEQAGADALELNMYDVCSKLSVPGAAIESSLVSVVKELKRLLKIPLAVKLSPFFTAFANVAHQLDGAGGSPSCTAVSGRLWRSPVESPRPKTVSRGCWPAPMSSRWSRRCSAMAPGTSRRCVRASRPGCPSRG